MTLAQDNLLPRGIQSWADIPTSLLRAELSRRQVDQDRPACGSGTIGTYNTPLHVGGLILILVVSVAACAFPIIVKRFPKFPVPHHILFLSRHFGTGVLLATAFVHLFPTAYISLTDPCLPEFWNTTYPAMPGLIAMTSVLIVVGIEMFFAMRGAGHVHGSGFDGYSLEENHYTSSNGSKRSQQEHGHFEFDDPLNDLKLDEFDTSSSSSLLNNRPNRHSSDDSTTRLAQIDSDIMIKPEPKALLQCLLLEAGILFHSVFIGMALSVTPAPAFYVLLIAITFHQTFEGLALGSRISALTFHPSSPHPWLMALAYGTTTPFGQAIGLAIHSMYDPESQTGLLSVGIMNALSSGLLLFAGLVELLAADFLSEESYMQLKGRKRLEACAAVVSGAALMALVGAWA